MKQIISLYIFIMFLCFPLMSQERYKNILQKRHEKRLIDKKNTNRNKLHSNYNFTNSTIVNKRVNAVISGFITDTSGNVLGGVEVEALDKFGYAYSRSNGWSSDGSFSIKKLIPGQYTLKFSRYNSPKPIYLGGDTSVSSAQWLTVSEGASLVLDTIQLYFVNQEIETPKDTFTVTGHLYDGISTNNPLVNTSFFIDLQKVEINSDGSNTIIGGPEIRTDSLGYFSAKFNREPGEYHAIVRNIYVGSSYYSPIWLTGEELDSTPTKITIPGKLNNVSLHCQLGAKLTGVVFNENGDTITGNADILLINSDGYIIAADYVSSSDPSFNFPGVKAGDYYIKKDYGYGYSDNWYYPGTNNITEAQKISLVSGQESTYNLILKGNGENGGTNGDSALITGTVVNYSNDTLDDAEYYVQYENGDVDWVWTDGDSYSIDVKAEEAFRLKVSSDMYYSYDVFSVPTWYENTATKNDAAVLSLSKSQEKIVNMKLLSGGSIAGFVKDQDGKNVSIVTDLEDDDWEVYSEYFFSVINTEDSTLFYYGSSSNDDFIGGFRIPGIAPGKYIINALPFSEYYGTNLDGSIDIPQPVGFKKMKPDTITVIDKETIEISYNVQSQVSGLITGTYTFDSFQHYDDDIILYAFKSDGSIASMSWGEWEYEDLSTIKTPKKPFVDFFQVDYYTWGELYGSDSSVKNVDAPIFLSQLSKGDYYVALLYWEEQSENVYVHWYGADSAVKFSEGDVDEIDLLKLTGIPNGAEIIKLDTDSSIVSGITFGKTPIVNKNQNILMSHFSKAFVKNGNIFFKYNVPSKLLKTASVDVFTLQGKKIYTDNFRDSKGLYKVDMSAKGLANGLYVIKFNLDNKCIKQPVMYLK